VAGQAGTCALSQRELIDAYFLEQRNNLLELAAFLDRLDRSVAADAGDDFRLAALRESLDVIASEGERARVERIQMILSDPRSELLSELDQKAAKGAYDPHAAGR
jgi:ABC-type uncharacterized transport system YnjBCD ATPase subunit